MKVKITVDERLVISAENELEAFALKTWYGRYRNRKSAKLEMDIPDEFPPDGMEAVSAFNKAMQPLGEMVPKFNRWLKETGNKKPFTDEHEPAKP